MSYLWQGVFVLATATLALSNDDIHVECGNGTVKVKWRVHKKLAASPTRLLLGTCFPSRFSKLTDGGGVASFFFRFHDCRFKRLVMGNQVIYRNSLTYSPKAKPKHARLTFPIECVYERPEGWIPSFLNPGFGSAEGHGGLVFHMVLLNDDFSGPALSNSFPLGSYIIIWAEVEQQAHQPLLLLLEACMASTDSQLAPESQIYPIIHNNGCLREGKTGHAMFLPRYRSSAVLLRLQAFRFALGEEVYIHCKLVAWDPDGLNEGKKACNYNKTLQGWELLDDPSQNALCTCCDHRCSDRKKRGVRSEPQGLVQNSVLGPLTIVENSSPGPERFKESLATEEGNLNEVLPSAC